MIYDLITLILTPFGIIPLTFVDLINKFPLANWFDFLSPDVLISWLFYVAFAWGMLYVVFVMPFRFFKWLLRVPDKNGKR